MKDEGPTEPAITIVGNLLKNHPTSGNSLSNKSGHTYVWQPTLALYLEYKQLGQCTSGRRGRLYVGVGLSAT